MRALALLLLLASGCLAAPGWTEAGFERAEVRLLEPSELEPLEPFDGLVSLDLTLVLLEGSNWTESRVLRHVGKTARIFAQCGLALGRVELVKARAPDGRHDLDMASLLGDSALPRQVYSLAQSVPHDAAWPVVFFVGRLQGESDLARSYRRGEVAPEDLPQYRYMNTAWISYQAHWIERHEPEYSTLAHELAHLLCECGHEAGPQRHLLHRYRNFLSARILPRHCEAFLSSPLVQPHSLER